MSPVRVLIVGVGNDYRGDDAAGLAVARALRESPPAGADVIEATGEGGRLIDAWNGYDAVVLVDAMRSGAAPGSVRRVDATSAAVPAYFSHRSTHALGVLDAVEIARAMNRLPARVVLYGVEGGTYDTGSEMSQEVEAAVSSLVDAINGEIEVIREVAEASANA